MAVVESLPRNRLAEHDGEGLVPLFEEFVRKECHFYVSLDFQLFTQPSKVIEETGIPPVDMSGNDVAMVFARFGDEGLFPFQVLDLASLYLARTKAKGEVADGTVTRERLVEKPGIFLLVTNPFPGFVDRNEDGLQVLDEHQEIVDRGDRISQYQNDRTVR